MENNFVQQGWQCPICKRILAPYIIECICHGQGEKSQTVSWVHEDSKTIESEGK